MKKLLSLLTITCFALMLTACGSDDNGGGWVNPPEPINPTEPTEPVNPPEPTVNLFDEEVENEAFVSSVIPHFPVVDFLSSCSTSYYSSVSNAYYGVSPDTISKSVEYTCDNVSQTAAYATALSSQGFTCNNITCTKTEDNITLTVDRQNNNILKFTRTFPDEAAKDISEAYAREIELKYPSLPTWLNNCTWNYTSGQKNKFFGDDPRVERLGASRYTCARDSVATVNEGEINAYAKVLTDAGFSPYTRVGVWIDDSAGISRWFRTNTDNVRTVMWHGYIDVVRDNITRP